MGVDDIAFARILPERAGHVGGSAKQPPWRAGLPYMDSRGLTPGDVGKILCGHRFQRANQDFLPLAAKLFDEARNAVGRATVSFRKTGCNMANIQAGHPFGTDRARTMEIAFLNPASAVSIE